MKLFIFVFLIINLYSQDVYVRTQTLNQQLKEVESDIANILSRSKETKKISMKFKEIVLENRKLFQKYLIQQGECKNLENIFQYQKSHSIQSFNLKNKS